MPHSIHSYRVGWSVYFLSEIQHYRVICGERDSLERTNTHDLFEFVACAVVVANVCLENDV